MRQLLTVQGEDGEDLAVFKYETFDEKLPGFPGYNSSVYLQTGSTRLIFLEEPVRLLLEFGSKFAQMKGLYDSARNAAFSRRHSYKKKYRNSNFLL